MPVNFLRNNPMTVVLAVGGLAVGAVLLTMVNGGLLKSQVIQPREDCAQLEADLASLRQEQEAALQALNQDSLRRRTLEDEHARLQYDENLQLIEDPSPELQQQLADLQAQIDDLEASIDEQGDVIFQTERAIEDVISELAACAEETPVVGEDGLTSYRELVDGEEDTGQLTYRHTDSGPQCVALYLGRTATDDDLTSYIGDECNGDELVDFFIGEGRVLVGTVSSANFGRATYNCQQYCQAQGATGGACESVLNACGPITNADGRVVTGDSAKCVCEGLDTPTPSPSEESSPLTETSIPISSEESSPTPSES